jgi:GNAT superfamily N-acetyltransferase
MSARDYGFAVDLANTMNWGMAESDFKFNQFLEPDGCLMLFNGSVPMGIATCVSFGKVGWFGNFVIKQEYQRHGAGCLLLEHAVNYLQSKGVESIGLYAYPHLEEYYGKFGFKADNMSLTVMHNAQVQVIDGESFGFENHHDFAVLTRFDCAFFGADRCHLLRSILQKKSSLCSASFVGGEMVGYVVSKNCGNVSEVGPLVCRSDMPGVAFGLLKVMLQRLVNKSVVLYLTSNQKGFEEFLLGAGFRKEFSLSRMFLGESKIQNGVYLAESLERG